MAVPFPSEAWIQALKDELNTSDKYADAAKNWEGDFYFIVEPGGAYPQRSVMYMDLWHGKCREAFEVKDENVKNPAFRMSAPYPNWKKVIIKELDPIKGLITQRLKLKGDMTMVMKNVKAAQELVNCCTKIQTQFPD